MKTPAICIAGWSGAGKTTLIERLIPCLTARGQRVAVVKHSHHHIETDRPGADSFRYRAAGAVSVTLAAEGTTMQVQARESTLAEVLDSIRGADLILVEGFDREGDLPTLEVVSGTDQPFRSRANVRRAVAADLPLDSPLPCFARNDAEGIAAFLLALAEEQRRKAVSPLRVDGRDVPLKQEEAARIEQTLRAELAKLGLPDTTEMVWRFR